LDAPLSAPAPPAGCWPFERSVAADRATCFTFGANFLTKQDIALWVSRPQKETAARAIQPPRLLRAGRRKLPATPLVPAKYALRH
jgi:hypothetical protein